MEYTNMEVDNFNDFANYLKEEEIIKLNDEARQIPNVANDVVTSINDVTTSTDSAEQIATSVAY